MTSEYAQPSIPAPFTIMTQARRNDGVLVRFLPLPGSSDDQCHHHRMDRDVANSDGATYQ
jgi:hypothetical protein